MEKEPYGLPAHEGFSPCFLEDWTGEEAWAFLSDESDQEARAEEGGEVFVEH